MELLVIEQLVHTNARGRFKQHNNLQNSENEDSGFSWGGGGFKGPETACQTGNIIRWLYNCNTFRKEKKGVILKALYKQIKRGKVQLYTEISSFIVFKSFARMNCIELFHL